MTELDEIRQRKMQEVMKVASSTPSGGNGFPDSPVVVTDSDFDETVNKYPLMAVDCWAPWCGPCRMLSPTVDAMAKDYKGKVVFAKLNTDESIDTTSNFRIMSPPALLYFNGCKLVD